MSITVLVTGAAGYIGSVLCQDLLVHGYKVLGVDNGYYNNLGSMLGFVGHKNFEFVNADVCWPNDSIAMNTLVKKADVIVPLAAIVGAPACDRTQGLALDTNYRAVKWIVDNISPYQRIIFPNTNSGYGSTDGKTACTEESPMNPVSLYGKTKCDAEKAVLDHPRSVVLRLATVFGTSPRMRFDLMLNDFVAHLSRKDSITLYEPWFMRNFVHIRDVSKAFRWFINDVRQRGPFNVGNPTCNMTKWELAHRIIDVLDLASHRPMSVQEGNGRDPDQRNYLVSNDKLLKTGFVFDYSADHGIKEVHEACRMLLESDMKTMRNT